MKSLALWAVSISLLAAPLAALAAEPAAASGQHKFYWTINGQISQPEDMDGNGRIGTTPVSSSISTDVGFGVGSAIGYQLPNLPIRVEGEVTYRYNEANDITTRVFGTTRTAQSNESIDSLAFMANGYYDINLGSRFVPYVGLGLGAVDVDGSDTVFGYQGMVGVSYSLNDTSSLYAGYRYLRADNASFDSAGDFDYVVHNAEVGYRLHF